MSPAVRQQQLDHMAPLIRGLVDTLAPVAVVRAAQVYANPAVERRDRLTALLVLLCFAARGKAGSQEARAFLALVQHKRRVELTRCVEPERSTPHRE